MRRRVVRVPASSANLGPGFDVLAGALSLHLELEAVETGTFAVVTDLEVPRDRSNLVVKAFERLHPADSFEFRIGSSIPLSGGLGSSAAATLAGLMAADHLFELDVDLLALATELEGHPDNAAAALEGGFVICEGSKAHRFDPPLGLEAVLVVPDEGVSTAEARGALPDTVSLEDAVFNVAAASTLMLGLCRLRLGSDLSRAARSSPPAVPGAALPALGCAHGARHAARGTRRDHLGRRPERHVLVALRADRRAGGPACPGDARLGVSDARPVRVPGCRRQEPVSRARSHSAWRSWSSRPVRVNSTSSSSCSSE